MATTPTLNAEFPCYTALNLACWQRPYEDLLDRLATAIGMDHAKVAFALIGEDIQGQSRARLMSSLLRAYGDDLIAYSQPRTPVAVHERRVGNPT